MTGQCDEKSAAGWTELQCDKSNRRTCNIRLIDSYPNTVAQNSWTLTLFMNKRQNTCLIQITKLH